MRNNPFRPIHTKKIIFSFTIIFLAFLICLLIGYVHPNAFNNGSFLFLIIIFGSLSILSPLIFIKQIDFYDDHLIIKKYFLFSKKIFYDEIIDIGNLSISLKKGKIVINNLENSSELKKILAQIITDKKIILENKQIDRENDLNELNFSSLIIAGTFSSIISFVLFAVLKIQIINIPIRLKSLIIFIIIYWATYYFLKKSGKRAPLHLTKESVAKLNFYKK